ncbi:MAG: T9SS type A sorting domain-containing protein [Flavobacterium sp.]
MKKLLLFFTFLFVPTINAQCWEDIALGGGHSVFIKSDGTLWATGWNEFGQLGDGTNENRNVLTKIGNDNDWKSVTLGSNLQTFAIKNNGTLWAWGRNINGQLGDGTNINKNSLTKIGNDNDWKYVAAGRQHSIAIKTDGTLWAWGSNSKGELGDGTNIDRNSPVKIGNDNDWQSIAAGHRYTMAIKKDGTLWTCGDNDSGQLGNGKIFISTNILSQIGYSNDWLLISTRILTSSAIKKDGTLWTWGNNQQGQLGNGDVDNDVTIPTQIGTDTNWKQIASGDFNSSAIKTDGTLWGWGINDYGELGDGTFIEKHIPTKIGSDANWQSIYVGGAHSGGLKTDGTLWIWGLNSSGQIGNGNNVDLNYPTQVNCPTLKIDDFLTTKAYSIYPNPTKDIINIGNFNEESVNSIKIIDLAGKLILKQSNNLEQINLSQIPQGIYIIQIQSEGKIFNQKIVKE